MTGATESEPPPKGKSRGRRRRVGLWTVLAVFGLFGMTVMAGLSLTGRTLILPDVARAALEARLNAGLPGGSVELGRIELAVDRGGRAEVLMRNIVVADPTGAKLADLNVLRTRLSAPALLRGDVVPTAVALRGAQITLRRDAAGTFTLSYGAGETAAQAEDIAGLLDAAEAVLAQPALAGIGSISADGLTITLEDARTGRLWQASNAALRLTRAPDGLSMTVTSEIFNGTEQLADVQVSARSFDGTSRAQLGATFSNVAAVDIAAQAPVLAYLEVLDAPISGAIRAGIDGEGELDSVAAALDIETGALRPTPETPPVPFDRARAIFEFDPDDQRIDFTDLRVVSEALDIAAAGRAWLGDYDGPWPRSVTGQFQVADLKLAPEGVFETAVAVENGAADVRLRLDPFTLEIGHATFRAGGGKANLSGRILAGDSGWSVALDGALDRIAHADLMAFWPLTIGPETRAWIARNVTTGTMHDIHGAIRRGPDEPLEVGVTYAFEDATIRYLPKMAPITGASGHLSIAGGRLAIVTDRGGIDSGRGRVDVAGSSLIVENVHRPGSFLALDLRTRGGLPATLAVLSRPPVRILDRLPAGLDSLAGDLDMRTTMRFQPDNVERLEDLALGASGVLTDFQAADLVPGRMIEASSLDVDIGDGAISIAGPVSLDGLDGTARWERGIGSDASPGGGRVTGRFALDPGVLESFAIALPAGSVEGRTEARFTLELPPDRAPELVIESDLAGLGLAVNPIGWAKPDPVAGSLRAEIALGPVPEVTDLDLSAPGLELRNARVTQREEGGLDRFDIPSLRVGSWLAAPVSLRGRGPGAAPLVEVAGGAIDIRRLTVGAGGGATGRSGQAGPIRLRPDRLIISDGLVLSGFNGDFTVEEGLSGRFRARVNEGTAIQGTVIPVSRGTAIRIMSNDAGGVVRDAGFLRNGAGGTFDLILSPTGQPGTYLGELLIESMTVRDAPALAALLDAISIVGLLDDQGGAGIQFDTVDARFLLDPTSLRLLNGAAVGLSMGISMDGTYSFTNRRADMQGVISPLYMVNGIGSIFTRRGEGLFGVAYTMTGPARAPRITVNPLSVFTPGIFREIFRRPPPRASSEVPGQ